METAAYTEYKAWKQWDPKKFGICNNEQAAYFAREMEISNIGSLRGRRILEIGFGNGVFAGWCHNLDCNYTGIEVIDELVICGRAAGFDVHASDISLYNFIPQCTVDLVAAWDVFEHIEINSLSKVLLNVKSSLRQGGYLFARLPSGDSPFSRSIQYGDLTHRTILGSSAVRQLARDVGLHVHQIREPVLVHKGLPIAATARRFAIECTRRFTYPILSNLFMGGGNPILTPNMIIVLMRK